MFLINAYDEYGWPICSFGMCILDSFGMCVLDTLLITVIGIIICSRRFVRSYMRLSGHTELMMAESFVKHSSELQRDGEISYD